MTHCRGEKVSCLFSVCFYIIFHSSLMSGSDVHSETFSAAAGVIKSVMDILEKFYFSEWVALTKHFYSNIIYRPIIIDNYM